MSFMGCEEKGNTPLRGCPGKGCSLRRAGGTSREVSPQDEEESNQGTGTGLRGKVVNEWAHGVQRGSQCRGTVLQSPLFDFIVAPKCKGANAGHVYRPQRIH